MGVASKITPELVGWGVVIMLVVVISLILLNFKTSGTACTGGTPNYNATLDGCCATAGTAQNCTINSTPEVITTINTSVTAFQEPANWIQIVIISLIGAAIIALFFVLFKMRK